MLEATALIFIRKFFEVFFRKSLVPYKVEKILRLFNSFGINAAFLYVTLQGLEWQFKNASYYSNCEVASEWSWISWLVITVLLFIDAFIVFTAVSHIILWRKYRRYRRMQGLVSEIQIMEEYVNGGGLAQLFIPRSENESEDEQVITLTMEDLHKIPRKSFTSTGDRSRQSIEEACPVCFEDFREGDELCVLPQCNHVFHTKCIYSWFGMSTLCPMCRCNVKENIARITPSLVEDLESGE